MSNEKKPFAAEAVDQLAAQMFDARIAEFAKMMASEGLPSSWAELGEGEPIVKEQWRLSAKIALEFCERYFA